MKIIKARILDGNRLELEEPISGKLGEIIEVVVAEKNTKDDWAEKTKGNFFKMYSEEDSVYDNEV